jgi:hypothetical protein
MKKEKLSQREKKALGYAVRAIYLADSANYAQALYAIIDTLDPKALDLLEEDDRKAYKKYARGIV